MDEGPFPITEQTGKNIQVIPGRDGFTSSQESIRHQIVKS
jgi:hypothetical protein